MERTMNVMLCVTVLTAIAFTSCCKDSGKNANEPFTKGTWRITSFTENGIQQAENYKGYRFLFDADGKIAAGDETDFVTGNYNVLWSEYTDDMPSVDISFVMHFDKQKLKKLDRKWLIHEKTDHFFAMQQISPHSNGILTFEKDVPSTGQQKKK